MRSIKIITHWIILVNFTNRNVGKFTSNIEHAIYSLQLPCFSGFDFLQSSQKNRDFCPKNNKQWTRAIARKKNNSLVDDNKLRIYVYKIEFLALALEVLSIYCWCSTADKFWHFSGPIKTPLYFESKSVNGTAKNDFVTLVQAVTWKCYHHQKWYRQFAAGAGPCHDGSKRSASFVVGLWRSDFCNFAKLARLSSQTNDFKI